MNVRPCHITTCDSNRILSIAQNAKNRPGVRERGTPLNPLSSKSFNLRVPIGRIILLACLVVLWFLWYWVFGQMVSSVLFHVERSCCNEVSEEVSEVGFGG